MYHEQIVVDPQVMAGKPVIKGTRLPVEQILRELADGLTIEAILDAHPRLTRESIYAAIAYAADVIALEDIYLNAPSDPLPR